MAPVLQTFDDLWIWNRVGDAMPWYYAVATNRMPAKYLISRRIPCELDLKDAEETELWNEHARLTQEFLRLWGSVRSAEVRLSSVPRAETSLVDLSAELAQRMLRHCNFCRWNCRVDRTAGTKHGTCQLESTSRVSSYFHHVGEELVFRGTHGSGTIFFTSCNQRCAFCQNGSISQDKDNGIPVTPERLAAMAWQLGTEGCHNINWVGGEPTIHLHTIVSAIQLLGIRKPSVRDLNYIEHVKSDLFRPLARGPGSAQYDGEFSVPMLWNSNFFMSEETLRILRPLMDVWLPDFKFGNDKCAIFLSRTPWYFETVSRNHKMIHDWGEDVVIRHLVMPGHVECCTKPVLGWIAENMPRALVNVMDQYHPDSFCDPSSASYDPRYESLSRRPRPSEILEAYRCATELGLRFQAVTFEKSRTRLTL